ncbi:LLM class flavin-dependent oxidoreductase [Rhodococcus sp. IEGM 248]|uniref:LLM class flavin-dependent oxidoreductase n=1 Tax=Rhodococcus opacus TaxID=37919 RepID=UPI0013C08264|nr:LLM class flavin-dependent oxidoreductase [Rhodococcus opacus]MDV7090039.1 LLM class flavin-dependent oxidoreductase [Rhodococcus opacus]NDV08904.1 LLM class flavin-dependent oxidoreductase [Rhodococcus sp. IEGM 248]
MSPSRMHLAAFVTAGPGRPGGWRYPGSVPGWLSAGYYQNIARTLEDARFDLAFFADILSVPDRFGGSPDSQLRNGALGSMRLDPLHVLSSMGAVTSHLGLAATVSTTYAQPFTVARSFATLDHLTEGRAAWNVVTSFQESEARNFNRDEQFPREQRYERADEFLEVAGKLWDSWEDDALVLDTEQPLFADPDRVHPIRHKGDWFTVQGPLNVPRPPQGYPVVIQAGASAKGKDFAARWSDVIFCSHASLESAQDFYKEIKERAAAHGRDPEAVKILPSIAPVVGATTAIAQQTFEELFDLVPPLGGLSTLAYHLDVDLSTFPLDERLPDVEVPGVEGHYQEVREMTEREGLTLRELGKRYGGRVEGGFIGKATEVADGLQEWFGQGACDGFMVQAPYQPGGFEDFTRHVVPELQKRGLFRKEYEGSTLRENLGLPRVQSGEWANRVRRAAEAAR